MPSLAGKAKEGNALKHRIEAEPHVPSAALQGMQRVSVPRKSQMTLGTRPDARLRMPARELAVRFAVAPTIVKITMPWQLNIAMASPPREERWEKERAIETALEEKVRGAKVKENERGMVKRKERAKEEAKGLLHMASAIVGGKVYLA
jgi:hypothetical protein